VGTLGQETLELRLRLRDRVRTRDPDDIETVRAGDFGERRLDVSGAVQKSRSA
jgi:hypothetical protein